MAALPAVDPRPLAGWPQDAQVAVTLGRLAPEKSVDVVIDAFAEVAADSPALRLLVIGGGPSEASLRERSAMPDLAGKVHFTGQRGRGDALALAKGADIFLAASLTETQGLVVAEALALGLPVVALDGPGVADSVRDGIDGLVVAADAPGTVPRLAAALRELVRDPARRAALGRAAVGGSARFDVAARIGSMVALYRELLARRR